MAHTTTAFRLSVTFMHIILVSFWILFITTTIFRGPLQAGESEAKVVKQDFLLTVIPSLNIENASAIDAINETCRLAELHGASKAGFKGVMVGTPEAYSTKVSFSFKNVPFLFALQTIAKLLNADLVTEYGYVLIGGENFESRQETPILFPLKPDFLKRLGMTEPPTRPRIVSALQKFGLLKGGARVVIGRNREFAIVYAPGSESGAVRAVIWFSENGVTLHPTVEGSSGALP